LAAAAAALPAQALAAAPAAAAAVTAAAAGAAAAVPPGPGLANADSLSRVVLSTLSDCELAVSVYPTFAYNASGGGGVGVVSKRADGLLDVEWDAAALNIPAISYSTSKVLGVPLPPPLRIEIKPRRLAGTVDPATGEVNLEFFAGFEFTAGPLYRAPPLEVSTTLTSESSQGVLRSGSGRRLAGDGRARLVGVARVPATADALLNGFLMLPTDALAVLSADMEFS
jgi:hypothetical protein